MRTEPSTPFSSGTEYENFIYYFCERCKKGKRDEDGFPESPEEGGCPIWDAMENARFGQPFPSLTTTAISPWTMRRKPTRHCLRIKE